MTAPGSAPQKRFDSADPRASGAQCLRRAYISLAKDAPAVTEDELWPKISQPNPQGVLVSSMHKMAADAIARGFAAVLIQPKHPLQALYTAQKAGIQVIMQHRLAPGAPATRCSNLLRLDRDGVTIEASDEQRLAHSDFLELWRQRFSRPEMLSHLMLGISAAPSHLESCGLCRTPVPKEIDCGRCKRKIALQPSVLLGCMSPTCVARAWESIVCPTCSTPRLATGEEGAPLSASVADAAAAAAAAAPAPAPLPVAGVSATAPDPFGIESAFDKVDRFIKIVMRSPAVAANADVRKQVENIAKGKKDLLQAQADYFKTKAKALADMEQHKQTIHATLEAHLKQMAEISKPPEPVDVNALTAALLKRLGL